MMVSFAKIKKSSSVLFLLIALMLALQACGIQTTGKSIQPPSGRAFAVERSIDADKVTLKFFMDPAKVSQSEIVLIAEKVPDGATIISGSASIPPDFSSDTILVWLFAKNTPAQLGSLSVSKPIPNTLTYKFTGTATTGFLGKYGLKEVNEEGLITDAAGVCTQVIVCGTDGKTYTNSCAVQSAGVNVACTQACPCPATDRFDVDGSGSFDVFDVFAAINNYVASQGASDVFFVFDIINAYIQANQVA